MINIDKENFIAICKSSISMSQACSKLNLHPNTFIKYAKQFGCYKPNQGGKGMHKTGNGNKINLDDILNGNYPEYQTFKLKNRLIEECYKENKCECCGITEWNNKPLNMELHHIDGNNHNHILSNLMILCPNCHAQTDTYRAKNIKK
jgi:hypothetical protein